MNQELKPCPFCGGEAKHKIITNLYSQDNGAQFVECTQCGTSTPLKFSCGDDCKPLLAEAWNRRHEAQQPAGDVVKDAERYRMVRRGQHWSIINGIGDVLRGDDVDAAIDAAMASDSARKAGGVV